MIVGRFLGWLLTGAALAVLVAEIVAWVEAGTYRTIATGELWFDLHAASLNAAQAGIQRYLFPALWDPIVVTILLWPAWAVLGVPGLALMWGCRRRAGRSRRMFENR